VAVEFQVFNAALGQALCFCAALEGTCRFAKSQKAVSPVRSAIALQMVTGSIQPSANSETRCPAFDWRTGGYRISFMAQTTIVIVERTVEAMPKIIPAVVNPLPFGSILPSSINHKSSFAITHAGIAVK
jgi:hypothetical protein